ncbi:MAG: carotenoid biosynthesis protein [Methanobacteriales archaeon HGW-Methanobacteriales-1]|jgi:putative membrane protein|nr:MAG: carotenoid biosynthesis protein [Methanobacteriales archaeon HGW-Methanobacteriales-1]
MKDYSKYFWITAICLVFAAFFPAKLTLNPEMAPLSGIFIILLALPCYFALYKWLGLKKSLILIITLSIYAFTIETLAIITGFPYSNFQYTELIGFKILGYTPYTVPFAYVPLFIGCFYLASLKSINKWKIIILSTLMVLAADLILDPAAVALNFWSYQSPGFFYGVPLMNFMGWILTGFLSSLISVYILSDHINDSNKPKAIISSLFLILVFWSAVCFYLDLIIPGIIGLVFIGYILYETKGKIGEFSSNY